jgi:hypothetical protein
MEAVSAACEDSSTGSSLILELHERHAAQCAFLRACCRDGSLSAEQKLTILGLIDRLMEQEKILEWVMSLVRPESDAPIRQNPEFAQP